MINKGHWYGAEVEGRLQGLPTLFIRNCRVVENLPEDWNYCHIYLTQEFVSLATEAQWDAVRRNSKHFLTIEVLPSNTSNVPLDLFNSSHILLRLSVAEVARLKDTDTIVIDKAPYDCYSVTKCNMSRTKPQDYAGDYV